MFGLLAMIFHTSYRGRQGILSNATSDSGATFPSVPRIRDDMCRLTA
jgi:hypothetical protein